jgi:hypothetical protein
MLRRLFLEFVRSFAREWEWTFIATARAVSGLIAGTTLQIDETGTLTRSPVYSDACPWGVRRKWAAGLPASNRTLQQHQRASRSE